MQKKRRAIVELLEPRRLLSLTVTPYDPSTSVSTLTNALIVPGTGLTVTNSTFVGNNGQAGTYSGFNLSDGTTSVAMSDGILLTSGLATNALGPNNAPNTSKAWNTAGDSDLTGIIGGTTTYDANSLTLQFTTTAGTKSVGFDVVFGSEEFPEYVGGQYDDVFGAFLDGGQLTYDSSKKPLTVNNNFLVLNNSGSPVSGTTPVSFDIQYDGLTTALHTQASLDPSITTHTLKLAIADAADASYDSGVFLANLAGNASDPGGDSTGSPATVGAFQFDQATESTANTNGTIQLTVDRTGGSTGAATVDYATSDGTAIAGADYTAKSGTLDFADGQTTATITIPVIANAGGAASSNFNITLSNPTGGAALGSQIGSVVTLTNSKSLVQLHSATYSFANDAGSATLTVDRTGNTSAAATVDYATSDGTATAGVDYGATSGTLNFSAGDASESIVVPLIANDTGAAASNFSVTLSNPDSGTVVGAVNSAVVTEQNNYSLVQFASATSTAANNSGSLDITVTRTGNTSLAGAVDYATSDDSAVAGVDYTTTNGTLDFSAGQSSATIEVPLIANAAGAASSTFDVALSNPGGDAILSAVGTDANFVTLTNPNSAINLQSTTLSFTNDGTSAVVIVERSGNLSLDATVDYSMADDTAVSGTDYTASSGTLTFLADSSSASITIPLISDPSAAALTDFTLSLANPGGNGVLTFPSSATIDLQNSDALVQIASPTYVGANDSGSVDITITRAGDLNQTSQIDYATADGTALAGTDYTATNGTLTFTAGQSSQVISVPLIDNPSGAATSTFTLALSNPGANTVVGAQTSTTVTVNNNHSLVQFAATTSSFDNTAGNATLTVQRTGNLSLPASIDYTTADGTATAGTDYTATSGTLNFSAGQSSTTIAVPLISNTSGAAASTFTVALSNPGGSAVVGGYATATVTVLNNHSNVQIATGAYSFTNDSSSAAVVLNRTGNIAGAASVHYATSDGTAFNGTDYTAASGTATFSAGQSSLTLTIPIILNASRPAQTAFTLAISSPTQGAVLGSLTSTTVMITNAHAAVQLSSPSYTATTDDNSVTLTLTRAGNLTIADTVNYSTANGNAIAGTDYTAATGTVNFTAGQSTATIQIPLLGNVNAGATTGFGITLSNPTDGAVLGLTSSALIFINNPHSIAAFSSAAVSVSEAAGIVSVPVTRVGNLNIADTINFTTLDGTAVAPQNYQTAYGTIHFDPGQTVAYISVALVQDLKVDPTLTFQISLSSSGSISLGSQTIETVSITDSTPPPTILKTNLVTPSSTGTTAGTIAALTVTFDQALAAAPSASDFTLVRRYADGTDGGGKSAPIVIQSVSYDPTTKTLTIVPATPLKANQFYELMATGSAATNLNGTPLDGSGAGAGTPYTAYFGHGRHLTYIDKDGDRVHLVLHGPGVMQLTRSADGQGQTLTVIGATSATTLTGTVQPTGMGGDGTTTLASLSGLDLAHVDLKGSQFLVSAVHM